MNFEKKVGVDMYMCVCIYVFINKCVWVTSELHSLPLRMCIPHINGWVIVTKQFAIKKIYCQLKQEIVKFLNESGVVVSEHFLRTFVAILI